MPTMQDTNNTGRALQVPLKVHSNTSHHKRETNECKQMRFVSLNNKTFGSNGIGIVD